MLTPQEVSDKKFVKAVFGGYDMSMVDDFLEILTEDYTNLFKENAVLKSKLKVLVETVEEYRSVDDAMRKTLSNAQKMAGKIVSEAESRRDELLGGAENEARARIDELRASLGLEDRKYEFARNRACEFIQKMKDLYRFQIEALDVPYVDPPAQAGASAPVGIDETADEIFRSMERKIAEAEAPSVEEPEDMEDTAVYEIGVEPAQSPPPIPEIKIPDADDGDYDLTPKPKFEFQDLKFGREYQVNNKDGRGK